MKWTTGEHQTLPDAGGEEVDGVSAANCSAAGS